MAPGVALPPAAPDGGLGAGTAGARARGEAGTRFDGDAGTRVGDEETWLDGELDDEPGEGRRKGRRDRQPGERQARAWPRVVAVISWIVLVMVVCWFYVFPWLERVLPENF